MGMTAGLYRASAAEIQALLAEPESVAAFIDASTWAPPVRAVVPRGVLGWLLKLSPIRIFENDPDAAPPPHRAPDRPHCDLEGVWHGLHFLFTGTAWEGEPPASYLLRGGEEIGDADELGYAVLQALNPDRVRQFSAFLGGLSHAELKRRFDAARMMALEIVPEDWTRAVATDSEQVERLLRGYDELRGFVETTAGEGAGAVGYVS